MSLATRFGQSFDQKSQCICYQKGAHTSQLFATPSKICGRVLPKESVVEAQARSKNHFSQNVAYATKEQT